ncbi:Holliday junction branch migration protein RuvA [Nitrosomonas supralitoralis]|uniref:Holliday junction branch migration complex subunit RuvA n=1 Tax=Nitrosomonas supralitoralis TaxID=2116706 RepID=A0A2P7NZ05_9PROT|nr:Holliday junction branch migration protein RuvA [Nitrosomonas supralitoralis]PSJ18692.1 Holliday junction branch migration protein RuvA [Nitrosomonas supralitoralis]
MIGRLTGILLEKHPPQVLLEVQGVGYEVDVPMSTFYDLPAVGTQVTLYTHLVIREDMHLLFGFATEPERQTFRMLIKISGIGARTALALLSGLSVTDLYRTVNAQDSARLITVPGIGKKTAERLLLELRDKLDSAVLNSDQAPSSTCEGDILNALLSLGYSNREASWATKQISSNSMVSDGIRQALQLLSKET